MKTQIITWLLAGLLCSSLSLWGQEIERETPFRVLTNAPNSIVQGKMEMFQERADLKVLQSWPVEMIPLNWSEINALEIEVPNSEEPQIVFEKVSFDATAQNRFSWNGISKGDHAGQFSFTQIEQEWGGYFHLSSGYYSLVPVDDNHGILISHDPSYQQDVSCGDEEVEHNTLSPNLQKENRPNQAPINQNSTQKTAGINYCDGLNLCPAICRNMHILYVVTPEAESWFNNQSLYSQSATLNMATNDLNFALNNSLITNKHVFHNVVSYSGFNSSGSPWWDSWGLSTNQDLKDLRDQYGADLVFLVTNESSYGNVAGIAATINIDEHESYAIVQAPYLLGPTYILSHEWGHLLGGHHNRTHNGGNDDDGDCQHGWKFYDGTGHKITVMARFTSSSYQRLLRFSSPNINYNGVPTGTPADDNAKWISRAFCEVALFRDDPYCLTLQQDSADSYDAEVWSRKPNNNYGQKVSNNVYAWTNSGANSYKRAFINFDWSQIPAGATITDAKLSLFFNPTDPWEGIHTHAGDNDFYVERVIQSWDENSITWANQPATTSNARASVPNHTSNTQDFVDIDVTTMVQHITSNPSNQNGFRIKLQNEQKYRMLILAASEHADPNKRPKLEICYKLSADCSGGGAATKQSPEASLDNFVKVYPNPSAGKVSLDFESETESQIQVIDINGKVVYQRQADAQALVKLNLSHLAKGMYILRVQGPDQLHTEKIILE